MDRVFLDANVIFSAAYRTDSLLRHLWSLPGVELITSSYAVDEVRAHMHTPDQAQRLNQLLDKLCVGTKTYEQRLIPTHVDLPAKDRPILADAIGQQASHLLTGDTTHFGRYFGKTVQGVRILRPTDYLRERGFVQDD